VQVAMDGFKMCMKQEISLKIKTNNMLPFPLAGSNSLEVNTEA
jgi:hypothetical protein